jgi:hypothetical protein
MVPSATAVSPRWAATSAARNSKIAASRLGGPVRPDWAAAPVASPAINAARAALVFQRLAIIFSLPQAGRFPAGQP